jgi:F-type H+-transporting ATPase subunit b
LRNRLQQLRLSLRLFGFGFAVFLVWSALSAAPCAQAQQPSTAPQADHKRHFNEDSPATPNDEQREMDLFRHAPLVAKIGQKMGLDVETTAKAFEAVNFLIILLAIVIPILRIVPRVLRQRAERLGHDLQVAREATADAKTRLSAVEAKLAGLDGEIQKFRKQMEQESLEDEKRIKATIEEETARIVAAAEQEINMAAAQARRGLRHFAADLAIEQAEKQLVLTAESDRALISEFISDMAANGAGKGGNN